ncbi:MAG: ABC transporter permease [Desulfobacterales bacterium]
MTAPPTLPETDGAARGRAGLWRAFRRNRPALAGLVFFCAFLVLAVIGAWATAGRQPLLDPARVRLEERLRPPLSRARDGASPPLLGIYLLGTDELGRDLFARMLEGAWVSLTVGFIAVGISVAVGILAGGIAGYYGRRPIRLRHAAAAGALAAGAILGWTGHLLPGLLLLGASLLGCLRMRRRRRSAPIGLLDRPLIDVDAFVMRIVDILLCFPSFFLILTVVALLPPSMVTIMAVIGLTSWEGTARFVRAEFLSLREREFVEAARALGVGDPGILFRHMLPNALGPVLVSATLGVASAILTESGLSFLGFGVPPPHATWGNILADGRRFLFDAPWLTLAPGVAILLVVLAFNLFGEGLRDLVNPQAREGR